MPFPRNSHFDGNDCKTGKEANLFPLKVHFCGATMVSYHGVLSRVLQNMAYKAGRRVLDNNLLS